VNRVLIFDHDINQKNIVVKSPQTLEHINKILKAKVGDPISLCLVNQSLASGIIQTISESQVDILITNLENGLRLPYRLEVAASRPPTMKKVLEHGTSLGVSHFTIFKAKLSDKSYLQSHIYKPNEMVKYLSLGLAQSKALHTLPTYEVTLKKKKTVCKQKYILSLSVSNTFADEEIDFDESITLAIGPERGWTKAEEEEHIDQGYKPVSIGQTTLRVEIATFVSLGQLEMLRLSR
jgi:RsmE family RNA methyltransferase